MSNGIEIFCSIFTVNPKPFLTGLLETSIVSFGFGSERINFLKRNTLTVNGKSVIIGNGNVFCAASMFFTVVPVFMTAGAKDKSCRFYGIFAAIALGMMMVGAMGMNIVPKDYFGIVERFSVFAATGYNAVLGI